MSVIVKSYLVEDVEVEAQFIKTEYGFSVGVKDIEENEFVGVIRKYKPTDYDKAEKYYNELVSKM